MLKVKMRFLKNGKWFGIPTFKPHHANENPLHVISRITQNLLIIAGIILDYFVLAADAISNFQFGC